MKYLKKLTKEGVAILFIFMTCTVFSQAVEESDVLFDHTTDLVEGIYFNVNDIRLNNPSYKVNFETRGAKIFYKNPKGVEVELSPDSVYGYAFNNKIHLSFDGVFWRCVNIGSLTQFSEIKVISYIDYNPYNNATYERKKNVLRHLFLDLNTGSFKQLKYSSLKPYIEKEASLKKYIKKNNKAKYKELILILKAYNQLNPLYLSADE